MAKPGHDSPSASSRFEVFLTGGSTIVCALWCAMESWVWFTTSDDPEGLGTVLAIGALAVGLPVLVMSAFFWCRAMRSRRRHRGAEGAPA